MKTCRFRARLCPILSAALAALILPAAVVAADLLVPGVTPQQRAIAQQAAQAGVALEELAPGAPDEYIVRRHDTLWDIARMYLRSPWRWPQLWGMNLGEIRDPHWIYPGQVLSLDRRGGRARLLAQRAENTDTLRLLPRMRQTALGDDALPTLKPGLIEPFLSEPIVVDEAALNSAPRIVAGNDGHVLLARGDRAYVRSAPGASLLARLAGAAPQFRIFRNATPLTDPGTGEVLGYEAQYLGRARLWRDERIDGTPASDGSAGGAVPASIDITAAREEIRAGDRLLPEPARQLTSYTPHAPQQEAVEGGRIVSIHGNAVQFAAQNQVVAINKGLRDGIESGHVLAILKNGEAIEDRSGGVRERLKLPDERIGLLMVFRPFEKVSYALVLEINDVPRVGDLLAKP